MTSSDNAKEDDLRTSIFGTNHQVPKWVPVTLAQCYSKESSGNYCASSARARTTNVAYLIAFFPNKTPTYLTNSTEGGSSSTTAFESPVSNGDSGEQFFNGPLYTLKAFGIATALVTLGATASIWGVMRALDARNTNEFAERLRHAVLTKLPVLSYQIYRPAEPHQDDASSDSAQTKNPASEPVEWNWQEAEIRLREAFDKGGFHSWASAALVEVEAEATVERAKRGITQTQEKPTS
ncbi:uncharacterized protein BJ212DRAFT_1487329 [Suillus subaureus]|uniref:Uncharacterized protein n=1 Tax=Suillus subaureus TaxID=48587 RepID=A0A9P7J4P4_9AGAM|nr:uncharacterized protein BJ212DRAFT_1487329 [Suillus subaureus]KAG1802531.1 hypothetical protein BJ212DRAFT_1487329 [Suillus subaureus]